MSLFLIFFVRFLFVSSFYRSSSCDIPWYNQRAQLFALPSPRFLFLFCDIQEVADRKRW